MRKILETERLSLREFNLEDSDFVLKLMNSPKWIEFIGDRNIKTNVEAEEYLKSNLIKSYKENGFGLWVVVLKETSVSIGMCGLVNRETLEDIDIGFAMLPEYLGFGYGYEIANATMKYAKNTLRLDKIVGITNPNNIASIKLLNKIGLRFVKTIELSEKDTVLFFSTPTNTKEENELNKLTTRFFSLFTNAEGKTPNVEEIENIFISNGIIINNTHGVPEIYDLNEFISPRKKMLSDGTLTDFRESEILHRTEIYGNVAQRFSFYKKSGKLNGVYFESRGMKTIQFIKKGLDWKMSSVAWSDEK
ncbi:RimJ/RimL family protein N-acetyltransferase [Aquimarina sp. EL_43]|uniref:GNAT family N-acetyltransferase n=1 Tax=unclassified Aquimarina TaxID=2627091 RepID=UPI0018CA64C7|nr:MULTISPECIES: GNAT family N-acetyltransferase [unclassified Aquimarina]MBG6129758.1 RimJ/RimL family protein N-acetyltransferase [Aquimarina sp. EL_35]MBG6150823.1 RimJ/RimL family protein N-acetyltransferase [Aquimarina sp. EL_32]MBG6167870.1 RimJ/RimL family protein N-acetyltransferase [Aquimarina sp. EL_43]